jgi:outer membrane protein assembly factor BamB/tetratricopeptide (TPR) repeat protein
MGAWRWRNALAGAGIVALTLGVPARLTAQRPAPAAAVTQVGPDDSADDDDLAQNVFVPPDRSLLQELAKARQLIAEARFGEAVRCLGSILDGPEDYFFQPDKKVPVHRSLKAEAQRLIGQMPREGRELYELQYGARARQRLAEALSSGDASGLAEVSRRFFHTQAGYEATLLLGLDHLDHGRPLAGALSLQRLRGATSGTVQFEPTLSLGLAACWLQSGMPEQAREVLCAVKARLGGAGVEIGGSPVNWFQDEGKAVEWLARLVGPPRGGGRTDADSWLMFRGNPSRTATSSASAPLLNVRWRIPTTDDPLLEARLQRDREVSLDRGRPVLPALHPLAVNDVVLMRTFRNLLAVDFVTGKRLWEVPVDDPLEPLLGRNVVDNGTYTAARIAAGVGYRVWDDATYGTISSDGRYVFSVEDLSVVIHTSPSPRMVIINGRPVSEPTGRPFNRLAAHDIRTGKLKWEIGGSSDQLPLRQAETFFLGPPLPLMGRLYVLGESKGEIRLFALEAESGELIWSQQLALVERDVSEAPLRRLAGVSPSYADGILVCPTSAGAVVAVDLASRSLLWGYRYDRYPGSGRNARLIALRTGRYPGTGQQNRCFDAAAIVAGGRVLVAPAESDSLHCLNLVDGELLWKQPRNDDLFVACVYGDHVVLVGRREVRAISLSETVKSTETVQRMERTGRSFRLVTEQQAMVRPKPAWDNRAVPLPEGSMPTGRGFSAADRYFLPLSSAEVLTIDVAAGKAVQVSKSRKGNVPGNLVCYKGKVISQGVDGLEVFAQLDAVRQEVAQRLAAKPDDPLALCLQGEVLLDEGKQSEAIACFRRSYELDRDPRTRGLLRDALLDGLRLEFARHRDRTEEIEQLLDEPEQRASYLRLMATGLQAAGEWRAALDRYLELIDLDQDHRAMQPVTKALSVRLDRWVRAQLAALRRDAKGEGAAIDSTVEARLKAAIEAGSTDALRRFLDYFGDQPAAEKARRELVRRLRDSGRWLEAELVLGQQELSSDRSAAQVPASGWAVAELAELLRQAKRSEDAAVCYRRLSQQFADVVCLDGKTGKQLLAALPEDGPIRQILRARRDWPVGKVESRSSSTSSPAAAYPRLTVPYRGGLAPFFCETAVQFDQSRRLIAGCDALGHQPWQVSLAELGARRGLPFNYALTHARVCGHLLLLSLGYNIMAIDTLGLSGTGEAKLLWNQDLTDPSFDLAADYQQMAAAQFFVGGLQPVFLNGVSYAGYPPGETGGLGPVTPAYASFQRSRDLIATDPLTGELLWIRRGVAPGSTLFGDDQLLFAVAPNQTEATVFRAMDGEMLGKRKVPRFSLGTETLPYGAVLPDGTITRTRSMTRTSGEVCIAPLGRHLLVWNGIGIEAALELFDPWEQRQVWAVQKLSPRAKLDLVAEEAIGVLEPDGHFLLIGLPDGRTIVDAKLQREHGVASICVFRSGDQYVLLCIDSPPRPSRNRIVQVLPGNSSLPVGSGRVYAFDLEGKPLWPEPVQITDQHLLLNQPGRLPVLTFACSLYHTQGNSVQHQLKVLCIDKRAGRVVYDEQKLPYTTNSFGLSGDPTRNTVELQLSRQRVTLTFTDQPVPPPAKRQQEGSTLPSELPEVAHGLLNAIKQAIGEAAGKSVEPAGQPPRPQKRLPQIPAVPAPAPAPPPH